MEPGSGAQFLTPTRNVCFSSFTIYTTTVSFFHLIVYYVCIFMNHVYVREVRKSYTLTKTNLKKWRHTYISSRICFTLTIFLSCCLFINKRLKKKKQFIYLSKMRVGYLWPWNETNLKSWRGSAKYKAMWKIRPTNLRW